MTDLPLVDSLEEWRGADVRIWSFRNADDRLVLQLDRGETSQPRYGVLIFFGCKFLDVTSCANLGAVKLEGLDDSYTRFQSGHLRVEFKVMELSPDVFGLPIGERLPVRSERISLKFGLSRFHEWLQALRRKYLPPRRFPKTIETYRESRYSLGRVARMRQIVEELSNREEQFVQLWAYICTHDAMALKIIRKDGPSLAAEYLVFQGCIEITVPVTGVLRNIALVPVHDEVWRFESDEVSVLCSFFELQSKFDRGG